MALGISRAKAAILVAIADAGGQALTRDIMQATGLIKQTVLVQLRELEAQGYVRGNIPRSERGPGLRLTWAVDNISLDQDLRALSKAWTPRPRAGA